MEEIKNQPRNSVDYLCSLKRRLMVFEARRWLNFTEQGGDNRGQIVEAFQKAVDGVAVGEAWCLAFVFFCAKQVDLICDEIFNMSLDHRNILPKTEHCMTAWNKSPAASHLVYAKTGTVMIWQKGDSMWGHAGIVVGTISQSDYVLTVEGNTGPSDSVQREGDGVYLKKRRVDGSGHMKVKGWIDPWGYCGKNPAR